jgi:hypothetical protein
LSTVSPGSLSRPSRGVEEMLPTIQHVDLASDALLTLSLERP